MGQFDFPSAAALTRLKSDSLSTSPVDKTASRIASIASKILDLAGFIGTSTFSDLLLELKGLAADKDEDNLLYFGEALIDDIRRLYQLNDETRRLVEEQIKSKEFHQAVANATLHITRTNVEGRLDRVAILIANGLKDRDLAQESLDDMMRAAVELTEHDVSVLSSIYRMQVHLFSSSEIRKEYSWRINAIHSLWEKHWKSQAFSNYQGINGMTLNGSFARLQSAGLIVSIGTASILYGPTMHDYELLPAGKKFHERLQGIAVQQ